MQTSKGACGGAESEVPSSRAGDYVPKDLRFSIGPDIKDALPGFSWRGCCLIAGWVCPGMSISRKGCGGGVESDVLVVGGWCSGGGSRAQSQAEKVKVGAVAFLAPPTIRAQGDIIGWRVFSLHFNLLHLYNAAFLDVSVYNNVFASLSIEHGLYAHDLFTNFPITGAAPFRLHPRVQRDRKTAYGDIVGRRVETVRSTCSPFSYTLRPAQKQARRVWFLRPLRSGCCR
jgi:hypothetical protein